MATVKSDTSALLDQLQDNLDRVLEQTGKVFVAAKDDPKSFPVVQVTRLRQILPPSIDRFHMALDDLEHELQTAKLVMRRDLALCRERSVITESSLVNGDEDILDLAKSEGATKQDVGSSDRSTEKAPTEAPVEDVAMQDAQPDLSFVSDKTADEATTVEKTDQSELPTEDVELDMRPVEPEIEAENALVDQQLPDTALQIDTQPHAKDDNDESHEADEDRPPDTGTYTNDMESLFGGPTSAGPVEAPEFHMDPTSNTDFDFGFGDELGDGGADNDNISALLPGLQDYANNGATEGGDTNFDDLFSTHLPMANIGQVDGQQASTEHRDSTFDDLMDFADFNPGDYAEGGGSGGTNDNQVFDFSFD